MTSEERLSVNEGLSHLYDLESDLDEDVSETEDGVEEDPYHEDSSSSSSSSDDNETFWVDPPVVSPPPTNTLPSKNGELLWSASPPEPRDRLSPANVMNMVPGPTRYAVSHVRDVKSAFELFITPSIEKDVLESTNSEGRRVYGDSWTDLDVTHLRAFFGLLILTGVYKSKGEATASLWAADTGRAIFPATMSLNTFNVLSRVIRFDDRGTRRGGRRERDKLAAIRDVWDKWVQRLPFLYNPGPHVTVGERLVAFRGRCPFRQNMPSKSARYGIKVWAACDARSSYAWNMQVYTGKSPGEAPESHPGARVVLDLAEGLSGHNVTCDRFFTSYALGEALLQRKVTMLGEVRRTKPELPSELLAMKNRKVTSSVFAFTDRAAVVSYCPKRGENVLLMSTAHREAVISTRDGKPQMVSDYEETKGGVENLDKVTATYSCRRATARWPLVLFFNMLDVSAYNAFVIWSEINEERSVGKASRRRAFLEQLGHALAKPHIERRQFLPRASSAAAAVVRDIQTETGTPTPGGQTAAGRKRKRCQVCPSRKDSKTSNTCVRCSKYVCREHACILCTACVQ